MVQMSNIDDAKMMMPHSVEGTFWVLVEVDDPTKVGKDERRRVLMLIPDRHFFSVFN